MNEKEVFLKCITENHLKKSINREKILDIFLSIKKHLTLEELYNEVKKVHSNISFVTVYRTMKLLTECNLAREVKFADKLTRYEHSHGRSTHAHLICVQCGKCIEIFNETLEKIQEEIFIKNEFIPKGRNLELYGICKTCK